VREPNEKGKKKIEKQINKEISPQTKENIISENQSKTQRKKLKIKGKEHLDQGNKTHIKRQETTHLKHERWRRAIVTTTEVNTKNIEHADSQIPRTKKRGPSMSARRTEGARRGT